ncbi:integrase core domain-containing protein, partial [Corynebacterium amycolatum]|uniref:integrase core domain-containing protein n=1 Tax=Corynebacterium amycolatum TaxID=43765 RepID=UPI003B5BDEB5
VFIEGHSITFELFGIPRHGGRLPFFPTQPGWISGVYQTGVRSLRNRPQARDIDNLNEQLDDIIDYYNNKRPHRALNRCTPAEAY